MSKQRKLYTKAIESGIWYDKDADEHDYDAFFAAFIRDLSVAVGAQRYEVMRDYGIWFGPQR